MAGCERGSLRDRSLKREVRTEYYLPERGGRKPMIRGSWQHMTGLTLHTLPEPGGRSWDGCTLLPTEESDTARME
jgi:hypothetical protein